MKILVIKHYGQAGPYVMLDFADAFKELGHETVVVTMAELVEAIPDVTNEDMMDRLIEVIREMNVDFAIGYGYTSVILFTMENGDIENLFENLGIPYVSVVYDSPQNEQIFGAVAATLYSKIHYMFIWDNYYVEDLRSLGFRNVHYLPIASNTKRFYKIPEPLRTINTHSCDLSFIGAWSRKREIIMTRLLQFNPRIYGYLWENAQPEMQPYCKCMLNNISELWQLYNFSKINLNITMEQGISSLNMRVFDVMACEGFLITDYKSDLEKLFDFEKEIVCYHDVHEMVDLVGYYMNHDKQRREKARLARKRVLREHTYKKRAQVIIETLRAAGIGS